VIVAQENADDHVPAINIATIIVASVACTVFFCKGLVQIAVGFGTHQHQMQNYWMGAGILVGIVMSLALSADSWLRHVSNTLWGLYVMLMFWWPRMPLRFSGLLFCAAVGFWIADRHRRKLLSTEPGLSWDDVRPSLVLGGWAATAVVGVLAAGAVYAALCLLLVRAVQRPEERVMTGIAFGVVAVLSIAAWAVVKAVRTRGKGRAASEGR
jgi:hypothetical protein